ncbi:putative dna repair protein rad8 protein [Phaeoacremonium minimum UCRPA7]|uniref:Putative dna repair protein rad8 protein n=1 Tax=Phaeoacremonium minimum (strain UCR-PA7) TaxID=1286976 RepID=R8BW30_PHAM7|nr:putative dna repair protein rad8 protein [Phaeoacremonium minimum UCRPA7]EOO03509.1 putative dna repair protein rad8 protein [Phaeoacremonium minimum UCRPA7]
MIVDEYSYVKTKSVPYYHEFVVGLVADSKWLLSGTPPLQSLKDVCMMARIFGVHVASPEANRMPGLPAVTSNEPTEQTEPEKFRSYAAIKSIDFTYKQYEQGISFVKNFMSCNTVDFNKFAHKERVIIVRMNLASKLMNLELKQELSCSNSDIYCMSEAAQDALATYTVEKDKKMKVVLASNAIEARIMTASCNLEHFMHGKTLDNSKQTYNPTEILNKLAEYCVKNVQDIGKQIKATFDLMVWLRNRVHHLNTKQGPKQPTRTAPQMAEDESVEELKVASQWDKPKTSIELADETFNKLLRRNGTYSEDTFLRTVVLNCLTAGDVSETLPEWTRPEPSLDNWDFSKSGRGRHSALDYYTITSEELEQLSSDELRELFIDSAYWKSRHDKAQDLTGMHSCHGLVFPSNHRDVDPLVLGKCLEPFKGQLTGDLPPGTAKSMKDFILACLKEKEDAASIVEEDKLTGLLNNLSKDELLRQCSKRGLKPTTKSRTNEHLRNLIISHEKGVASLDDYLEQRARSEGARRYPKFGNRVKRNNSETEASVDDLMTFYELFRDRLEAFIDALRRYKFILSVKRLQKRQDVPQGHQDDLSCDFCQVKIEDLDQSFLLPNCGHFLCQSCNMVNQSASNSSKICPVGGCNTKWRAAPAIPCSKLHEPRHAIENAEIDIRESNKIQAVISYIKKTPAEDHVVIFVQFDVLRHQMSSALKSHGITFLGGQEGSLTSNDLEKFKQGGAKVLLLRLGQVEAAGANLTIANHVLFPSALHEADDHEFEVIMRQAKGRCLRRGQKKFVHIRYFICEDTIEEEIWSKQGKVSMSNVEEASGARGNSSRLEGGGHPGDRTTSASPPREENPYPFVVNGQVPKKVNRSPRGNEKSTDIDTDKGQYIGRAAEFSKQPVEAGKIRISREKFIASENRLAHNNPSSPSEEDDDDEYDDDDDNDNDNGIANHEDRSGAENVDEDDEMDANESDADEDNEMNADENNADAYGVNEVNEVENRGHHSSAGLVGWPLRNEYDPDFVPSTSDEATAASMPARRSSRVRGQTEYLNMTRPDDAFWDEMVIDEDHDAGHHHDHDHHSAQNPIARKKLHRPIVQNPVPLDQRCSHCAKEGWDCDGGHPCSGCKGMQTSKKNPGFAHKMCNYDQKVYVQPSIINVPKDFKGDRRDRGYTDDTYTRRVGCASCKYSHQPCDGYAPCARCIRKWKLRNLDGSQRETDRETAADWREVCWPGTYGQFESYLSGSGGRAASPEQRFYN